MSTTGDVFDPEGQRAVRRFVENGRGYTRISHGTLLRLQRRSRQEPGQAPICSFLLLDEPTYDGGTMGDDPPIARRREVGADMVGDGHTNVAHQSFLFRQHLLGGPAVSPAEDEFDRPSLRP